MNMGAAKNTSFIEGHKKPPSDYDLMNKLQKVDTLFQSSFDELIETIFQKPVSKTVPGRGLPLNNIGDYIDLYKDKKQLETRIDRLKEQMDCLSEELYAIEIKEMELKKTEKTLVEEKNLLKNACENKSLFLANMSHEIRTPMSGVIGSLEILKQTGLNTEQLKYLDIIETCANTLLSLVDDVLDYSKIEANELKIESVDFSLKEIVSQVRDILFFKAQEKRIEFTTHIVHNVPLWLQGDPLRIRQVLLNLASNAVKFTDKGNVAIEVTLQSQQNEQVELLFKVKDTGIGIKPDLQKHLFQSYSQVNPEITRKFGGTGLGLAICKKLTDLMKGSIGVDSKEGAGSEFWFSIPLKKQEGTQKHQIELMQIGNHHKEKTRRLQHDISLLLVEDDAINQKISSILLEKEGYKVIIAESGFKALEILKSQYFDLVLMDVEMPGLSGYETTKRIRHQPDLTLNAEIPIVAMTAHAMSGDREKCMSFGMNDYLTKPINIPVLNEIVNKIISSNNTTFHEKPVEDEKSSHFSVIDLDKLIVLKQDLEERFELLIKIYIESIPQKLRLLKDAIEQKNFDELRTTAHQLKGSSASFYAENLVELCEQMEIMAIQAQKSESGLHHQHLKKIESEAGKVIAFLQHHFP